MGSSRDDHEPSVAPDPLVDTTGDRAPACPLFTEQELAETGTSYCGPPMIQPVEERGGRYRVVQRFVPNLPPSVIQRVPLCVPADSPDQEPFYNGASVPFIAWWFLRPMEPRVVAGSLVHDMLYTFSGILTDRDGRTIVVSRHFADIVFLVLMFRSHYEPWRSWVTYLAVRTFSARLFDGGQPLPEPSPSAHDAEHQLNRIAWTVLTDQKNRASFFRMFGVLFFLFAVGANTLVWSLRSIDVLPLPLLVPLTLFGLSITLTATTIPVVSVGWILDLRARTHASASA